MREATIYARSIWPPFADLCSHFCSVHIFFVTLQEFSAFLYIKAVWGIEENQGYELATVLNSTFCYKLHPLELCSLATNGTQERTPDDEPPAVL